MTNNAPQTVAPSDAGIFAGGIAALSTWLNAYGWGVIGLGMIAMAVTGLGAQGIKMILDIARSEERAQPLRMGEDVYNASIRFGGCLWGAGVAVMLGFGDQVGPALGVQFNLFSEIVIGGALNYGVPFLIFHVYKWLDNSESDFASRVRTTGRIWWNRLFRITPEEYDAASTGRATSEDMAAIRALDIAPAKESADLSLTDDDDDGNPAKT